MVEFLSAATQTLPPWALGVGLAVLVMLPMLLLKRLILVRISKLIEQTPFQIDSLLIHALRLPFMRSARRHWPCSPPWKISSLACSWLSTNRSWSAT